MTTPVRRRFDEACAPSRTGERSISFRTCTCRPASPRPWPPASHLPGPAQDRADAVFILGDLFEVWVGDDAHAESPWSITRPTRLRRGPAGRRARVPCVLHARQPRLPLAGPRAWTPCGMHWPGRPHRAGVLAASAGCSAMATPCAWTTPSTMRFRAQVRSAAWQRPFPGAAPGRTRRAGPRPPRPERGAQAQQRLRPTYADVDAPGRHGPGCRPRAPAR